MTAFLKLTAKMTAISCDYSSSILDLSQLLELLFLVLSEFVDKIEPLLLCVITLGNLSIEISLANEIGKVPSFSHILTTIAEKHIEDSRVVSAVYLTLSHLSRSPSMAQDMWMHGLDQVCRLAYIHKHSCDPQFTHSVYSLL